MVQIYGKLTDSMIPTDSIQNKSTKRCKLYIYILVGTAVALCATNYTVAATACT